MQDLNVYEQFRDSMRRFATDKVAPHAAEADRTSSFPAAAFAAFREEGLLGLAFEEDLGGQNGDLMSLVICGEEVARCCATSSQLLMNNWIASFPLLQYATRELIDIRSRNHFGSRKAAPICGACKHGPSRAVTAGP